MPDKKRSLIHIFTRHKVAANLLMLVMILAGLWSLARINTQFFPSFHIDVITIQVVWQGSSAEDVQKSITIPMENELRNIANLKKLSSDSKNGSATIFLEFKQNTDMGIALDQVKERIGVIRNLPQDAEKPIVNVVEPYEEVAKLIITSNDDLQQLRPLVYDYERQLLDRGIAKVDFVGLPEQRISIEVPLENLATYHLSLNQIADKITARSQDLPAGNIGQQEVTRTIRSLDQQRSVKGFEQLPIISDDSGQLIRLRDVAAVKLEPESHQSLVFFHGKPAVEMILFRTENSDTLASADIFHQWLKTIKPQLPANVQIHVYNENWQYVKERINLLLKNGLGGLALILIILFLFLNARVAFWVAMGIPISFMAALGVLYLIGGSINMISLFAFIMALGIIVDDTIVVGEDTLTQLQRGNNPLIAAESGARRMLIPVMASSLTTLSAFLPLFLVGGVIGTILMAIPTIVVCVIIASLLECFLVLPGHLYHSYRHNRSQAPNKLRQKLDNGFNYFKQHIFRKLVTKAVSYRWSTLSMAFAVILLAIGLVMGGRVNFTFFPSPDGTNLFANVQFTASTPPKQVKDFLKELESSLYKTERQLTDKGPAIINTSVVYHNKVIDSSNPIPKNGEHFGSMSVELSSPDDRTIKNNDFIKAWRNNINLPPGVESFTIAARRSGPPGKDIAIQLSGKNIHELKAAAVSLTKDLQQFQGVSNVKDDLPYGTEQLIYQLNPVGESLGLTINDVGRQIRSAFTGHLVQIFHQSNDEIEVKVMLPKEQRYNLNTLNILPIVTPNGDTVPLNSVINITEQPGTDLLRHADTKLTITVKADVDNKITNSNKIIKELKATVIPKLTEKYATTISFEGKAEEQRETLQDMKQGLIIALCLIYVIITWVFGSYGWPLIIMSAIPFGLVGAIAGHWLMGIDLTILSLFGIFGLAGIVVNDSIILLNAYKQLRIRGIDTQQAIIEAACQRLRAVLLTSLTTIAGLTPLLFEKSLQAQFLIPMAASISFGLISATFMILLVIPAMLSIYEDSLTYLRKYLR